MFIKSIKGTKEDRSFKYNIGRILGLSSGQARQIRDLTYKNFYKRLSVMGLSE